MIFLRFVRNARCLFSAEPMTPRSNFRVHQTHQTRDFAHWNDCSFDFSALRADLRVVSRRKTKKMRFFAHRACVLPQFFRFRSGRSSQVSVNLALRTYLPRGFRTGFRMFETVPSALWMVWWQAKTQVLL